MDKLKQLIKPFLAVLLPVIIILGSFFYFFSNSAGHDRYATLTGQPLAAKEAIYPVAFNSDGKMFLDKDRFGLAIEYLTNNPSQQKAASDLVYLGQSNQIELSLNDEQKKKYHDLVGKGFFTEFQDADKQKDQLLQNYRQIVEGVGKTFAGANVEVVLHDTRDPLHSVSAIQNPISGRKLGDNNSNFGVGLIKLYSAPDAMPTNFVSYPLKLKDGRDVKSTTIPLFNPKLGLIGFICINIDISKLDGSKAHARESQTIIDNFKLTQQNADIQEVIEIIRKK